jgi:hypothetical protein
MHVKNTINESSMSVKRDVNKEKARLFAYNEAFQKLKDKTAKDTNGQKGGSWS